MMRITKTHFELKSYRTIDNRNHAIRSESLAAIALRFEPRTTLRAINFQSSSLEQCVASAKGSRLLIFHHPHPPIPRVVGSLFTFFPTYSTRRLKLHFRKSENFEKMRRAFDFDGNGFWASNDVMQSFVSAWGMGYFNKLALLDARG